MTRGHHGGGSMQADGRTCSVHNPICDMRGAMAVVLHDSNKHPQAQARSIPSLATSTMKSISSGVMQ